MTTYPLISYYQFFSTGLICSGCLWTFKSKILSATNDTFVRDVFKCLSMTTTGLLTLSSSLKQRIIDWARLASIMCMKCDPNCLFDSSEQVENTFDRLLSCGACVSRRCLRLLPRNLSLHGPRWFRVHNELGCKTKYLEDLDPRLKISKIKVSWNLSVYFIVMDFGVKIYLLNLYIYQRNDIYYIV